MGPTLSPAVFLDRDGTLMEEVEYCRDPEKVRLLPGVPEGLARLKEAGFRCIIITNQSGIGRGWITMPEYEAVHARLLELLNKGLIDATYFCPDAPGTPCECRKPAPGMVLSAARDLGLDLSRSWFVGDKDSDVGCGRNAGTRTILVQTGYGKNLGDTGADFVAEDFATAVERILRES
ncbi:D-glycero-alpha-D-manno-heptose-1,7-bisphosphate 7-phosphatase [Verrucomicrobiota bacterium sgz303538]